MEDGNWYLVSMFCEGYSGWIGSFYFWGNRVLFSFLMLFVVIVVGLWWKIIKMK